MKSMRRIVVTCPPLDLYNPMGTGLSAAVAELAYALDLGSSVRKDVEVRLLSAACGLVQLSDTNIHFPTLSSVTG